MRALDWQKLLGFGLIVLFLFMGAAAVYGYLELTELRAQLAQLTTTTEELESTIHEATTTLGIAIAEESQNVQGVQEQVGSLSGTLTDLQKLTKTDREFLAKYSKVFFLSENYAPARLVSIPSAYGYVESKELQIIPEVLPYLEKMLDQAKRDDIDLYVYSAYRSFNAQGALKGQYSVTYGAGTANQFSADQGYSEHQLGTAVDFITTGTEGMLPGFGTKPAYEWMQKNAYRYGFVLSYPKDNAYYVFEPWHWRFVGVKLATDLHNAGLYFYQMDQRTIDTYLTSLFD